MPTYKMYTEPMTSSFFLQHKLLCGIVAGVLLLAIAAGGTLLVINKQAPAEVVVTEESQVLSEADELKLQEEVGILIESGDIQACEQIADEMYKSVCINNIALEKAEETKDISWCQLLDGELVSVSSCETPYVTDAAIAATDVSICATASATESKSDCTLAYAYSVSLSTSAPNVCDEVLTGEQADGCWNSYYVESGLSADSFACPLLRGEDAQADCQVFTSAMLSPETSLQTTCQSLTSSLFMTACFERLDAETGLSTDANGLVF